MVTLPKHELERKTTTTKVYPFNTNPLYFCKIDDAINFLQHVKECSPHPDLTWIDASVDRGYEFGMKP